MGCIHVSHPSPHSPKSQTMYHTLSTPFKDHVLHIKGIIHDLEYLCSYGN